MLIPLKKLPSQLENIAKDTQLSSYESVNLYFQDESRFGLMTRIGKVVTAIGVKPLVKFKQAFKNTYLYGSFSPINGDSFLMEIEGVSVNIFETYLTAVSKYKPKEFKIIIIDNAGFHSTANMDIPDNIALINIPPYSPELNPAEKVWGFMKEKFKNKVFDSLDKVKEWIYKTVKEDLTEERILSLTHSDFYLNSLKCHLEL